MRDARPFSTAGSTTPRLNLARIEFSLRQLQAGLAVINRRLSAEIQPLEDEIIAHLMAAYQWIDAKCAAGEDLLDPRRTDELLRLNALLLCGPDPERLARYQGHLEHTRRHFYDHARGAVRDLIEWTQDHRDAPIWERAAWIYLHILSRPQLFPEGNHRTGALVVSCLLLHAGRPPFVLSLDHAEAYFTASAEARQTGRRGLRPLLQSSRLRGEFARLFQASSNPEYLLPANR